MTELILWSRGILNISNVVTHFFSYKSFLYSLVSFAWKIPRATIHGVAKSWTRLGDFTFTFVSFP